MLSNLVMPPARQHLRLLLEAVLGGGEAGHHVPRPLELAAEVGEGALHVVQVRHHLVPRPLRRLLLDQEVDILLLLVLDNLLDGSLELLHHDQHLLIAGVHPLDVSLVSPDLTVTLHNLL